MSRDTGWFKSSYSNSGGDQCVEVRMLDTGWFKSSRSNSGGDNCVEVRMVADGPMIGLRDSKNPAGGAFWVSSEAWSRFVTSTSSDEFDRL